MNKEFLGKKKFYLEDHPETFSIARLYVVETRQNEYLTAVFDNGDAFQIETFEGPCGPVKYYVDFENRRFSEYPILSVYDIRFFDRRSEEIGVGEVSLMRIGTDNYYMGGVIPARTFKYKKNGWDFSAERGDELVVPMTKSTRNNMVMPFVSSVFDNNNKVPNECLENKYYQIWCFFPEKLRK